MMCAVMQVNVEMRLSLFIRGVVDLPRCPLLLSTSMLQ